VIQRLLQDVRPLVFLVIVALATLVAATTLLARVHAGEKSARAARHVEDGERRLAEGDVVAAVPEFRAALALVRDRPEPLRRLAQALLALGQLDEAEAHLRDLLARFPVDGPVNRDLARVAAAKERTSEARAFYQRAIYGEWPDRPAERRVETRFELAGYLHRTGDVEELIAELLLLKAEVPADQLPLQRHLADLFLEVTLPAHAIDVLTAATAEHPGDAPLLGRLAEAQLADGRMADARATLRLALARDPSDGELRARMTLIDRVLALDPTLPRLSLVERTRRSRAVLEAVIGEVAECEVLPAPVREELQSRAQPALRAARDAEAAEEALRLAGEIWSSVPACHGATVESEAIGRVLRTVFAQDAVS
jgi:tetratricopeptide (TPR) repeat protein